MLATFARRTQASVTKGSCITLLTVVGYTAGQRRRQQHTCRCETWTSPSRGSDGSTPRVVLRSPSSAPASLIPGERFQEVRFGESSALFWQNSILLVPNMLSKTECEVLVHAAEVGVAKGAGRLRPGAFKQDPWKAIQRLAAKHGLWSIQQPEPLERMPVCDLGAEAQELSATLLRDRMLPFLEQQLPQVAHDLFGRSSELNTLHFRFSPDEPAINRYTTGGGFRVHTDDRSITVYVLLSNVDTFSGGGTAFWNQDLNPEDVGDAAELLLQPGQGVGVIFNGRLSHAGAIVTSGTRHLYVASFDLQPPPAANQSEDDTVGYSMLQVSR